MAIRGGQYKPTGVSASLGAGSRGQLARFLRSSVPAAGLIGIGLGLTLTGLFAYETPPWTFISGVVSGPGFLGYPSFKLSTYDDSFNIYNVDEFRPRPPDLSVGDRVDVYLEPDPYHIPGGDYTVLALRANGQLYETLNYETALAQLNSNGYRLRALTTGLGLPTGLGLLVIGCVLGSVWANRRNRLAVFLCVTATVACIAPALIVVAWSLSDFDVVALLGWWPYLAWAMAAPIGVLAALVALHDRQLTKFARTGIFVALPVILVLSMVWVLMLIIELLGALGGLAA